MKIIKNKIAICIYIDDLITSELLLNSLWIKLMSIIYHVNLYNMHGEKHGIKFVPLQPNLNQVHALTEPNANGQPNVLNP